MGVLRAIALLLVLSAILVGGFVYWAQPTQASPELLFVGGDIITMAEPPVVRAMWVSDGRIRALGTDAEVREAAGPDVRVIDLEGAALMPGLIEPHTHPLATALLGTAIDVSGFTHDSREGAMRALREGAEGFAPQPWLVAFGWDPVMVADLEPPTLAELDAISPDKPLFVLTQMTHEAYANSAALSAAGVTRDTPDPPGASFGRDDNGDLDGTIHEVAAVKQMITAMPPVPTAVAELLLRWQYADYAEAGFTTIGVLGAVGRAEDPIAMMQSLSVDPHVPVRAVVYGLPTQLDSSAPPPSSPNARFAVRGVKFWMDGSPYTGGAAFEDPYENTTLVLERLHLPSDHLGPLNYEADAFTQEFERFHRAGYQIAVHTQGERAIERALDAAQDILTRYPRQGHGHRLEHNALIQIEQIQRAKDLGFELSFFVDHIYYYGDRLSDLVGTRVERYMPVGSALQAGHQATIHTDNPATPIGPFRAMRTAMLRVPRKGGAPLGPDERITVDQALRTMTINAAHQLGVAEDRGSLEVGKAADLVVLSTNPLKTAPDAFGEIEVVQTWLEGQPVDTRKASRPNLDIAARALQQLARQPR